MDHKETWRQIGFWTKCRLGIDVKTMLGTPGSLSFAIASEGEHRIEIRLNGRDTYDLTIGHLDRETFDWIQDGEEAGIDVTGLNESLERLAGLAA